MPQEGECADGTVVEDRPNGMYLIELDNGTKVTAHVGPRMRMRVIRIRPGERVQVEISAYDLTRGRIVDRFQ